MSLPPPAPNQAYCKVSALEGGKVDMDLDQLIDIAEPGQRVDLPVLIFLLRHSITGELLLFDLGIRPDVENVPIGALAVLTRMGVKLQGQPDLRAALAKGGLSPEDIKHIVISHIHFDHTGDPSLFPAATYYIGADASPVIQEHAPHFHGTVYAVDTPPERTQFLEAEYWPPLGPFVHALDFFGDGSAYVVDAAGHVPGHLNLLVRTSEDGGWLLLAGDSAHDWRIINGKASPADHPVVGCLHRDLLGAAQHVERIRELKEMPRVRVLLAHDVPWYEENKGGPAFWPGSMKSL
ncbi:beta-lactamase-like protein [Trametes meyenii]|nr:beta-lactamase-like protein [Trametes meyenii]